MGAIAAGVKAIVNVISFGGTGAAYITPMSRDIVYTDPSDGYTYGGIKVSADRAMGYIPFFAAVRNISEDVAGLPLNVYERSETGRKRDLGHPVDALMHSAPNPYMTAFSFRETLQSHVLTWGNGYAEIEYGSDGSIVGLWPLRPDRVTVFIDRSTGEPAYRYQLAGGGHVDLPRWRVFHVHGLGYDGLVGYSVIEKARRTLGMAIASETYGEDWYEKGGTPKAVLKHPNTLGDNARRNLRESWDANYGSLSGRQRTAILEEGMDFTILGIPPKDARFIETLSDTRSLMATLFRMPPDMLGDVSRSTSWGTGIEQQGIAYVKYTLRGNLIRWEQEGDMRLLRGEPRYMKHVVDGLMRGDTAARWASYTSGMDRGVYSIDDVLEMEDRNGLPDGIGQRHFVPLNMAPLDQVGEMSMDQRIAALGGLIRAGFAPEAATEALDLPKIAHTGLEPVTVQADTKSQLSVVKMAEFDCPDCGKLIGRKAAPGSIGYCGRCKAEKVMGEVTDRPVSNKGLEDRLDALPERLAAAMPRQEPPTVTFAEGAIRVEQPNVTVNVPEQQPANVTVNVPPPKPTTKTVNRDKSGQVTSVTETPDGS